MTSYGLDFHQPDNATSRTHRSHAPHGRMVDATFLAYIVASKFCDHIPLCRLAKICARRGLDIDHSQLAEWLGHVAWLFAPLVELIAAHVMAGRVLHCDDTPIPVLAQGAGKTKAGGLWVYLRDVPPHVGTALLAVLYRYTPDRKCEHYLVVSTCYDRSICLQAALLTGLRRGLERYCRCDAGPRPAAGSASESNSGALGGARPRIPRGQHKRTAQWPDQAKYARIHHGKPQIHGLQRRRMLHPRRVPAASWVSSLIGLPARMARPPTNSSRRRDGRGIRYWAR